MPAPFGSHRASWRVLAGLAAVIALSACTQDVCAGRQNDVVGCGGHWDQIYHQIRTPSSPG